MKKDSRYSELASYEAKLGEAISKLEKELAEADAVGAQWMKDHGASKDVIASHAGKRWVFLYSMEAEERILDLLRSLKQDIGSFAFRLRLLANPMLYTFRDKNWFNHLEVLVKNRWWFLNTRLLSDEKAREYLRTIAPLFVLYASPEHKKPGVYQDPLDAAALLLITTKSPELMPVEYEYPSLELMHFVTRFLERHGTHGLSSTYLDDDRLQQLVSVFLKSAEYGEMCRSLFSKRG